VRTEKATSAGGVVLRRRPAGVEVVLCGRERDGVWSLPKGTPEAGEDLEAAALREVAEETGLEVAIECELGHISYWFTADGVRYHKTVHFYAMSATGGSLDQHDREFDDVRWFPASEALGAMTYPNERLVVEKALATPVPSADGTAARGEG
jgi:8-oxo-dGTP pyrophosphatase MutT (NUDIX family)